MPPDNDADELARGEWTVLALVVEQPTHGWALSRELLPGGEIGQIWAGDRTRVYRALRKLQQLELIEPLLTESGGGPTRTVYRATAQGRARLLRWLQEPTENLREIQSAFALKLAFLHRAGMDPTRLLAAQRAMAVAAVTRLSSQLAEGNPDRQIHVRLRLATIRALLDLIDELSNAKATQPGRGRSSRAAVAIARPAAVEGGSGSQRGRGRGRTRPSAGPVSDFSGAPIATESDKATVIVRFNDAGQSVVVATAHVDDPVIRDVLLAGQQLSSARGSGQS